jgi:hypothetical protein
MSQEKEVDIFSFIQFGLPVGAVVKRKEKFEEYVYCYYTITYPRSVGNPCLLAASKRLTKRELREIARLESGEC